MDNAEEDVIVVNEKLNQKLENRESKSKFYNRPPIAYALLVFILVIVSTILVITVINGFDRTSRISKTDSVNLHETQLLCVATPNRQDYAICRSVGLPSRIGAQ